ncbi:MAG: HAD family phosphatase [Phycisphaerales bacterium]|nr:HAD family phosphatase [Phycisphaerales bacterium]
MNSTSPYAVIFDVDGVLVDSYEAHRAAFMQLADKLNTKFTDEDFTESFGRTSRDILRTWFDPEMSDEDVALHDGEKEANYRALVTHEFPAMAGATELIDQLHAAGFKQAMGSSGPPENVKLANTKLGSAHAFGALVTGMDVTHGKPDPEVFLVAADRLGIRPRDCCVIEDAPAGIQAARAAGMTAIGFASRGRTRAELLAAQADLVVSDLKALSPHSITALIAKVQAKQSINEER